jgi:hypothetical protein
MVAMPGRGGLAPTVQAAAQFARPTGPAAGNNLPAHTGIWEPHDTKPGPGYGAGLQMGGADGFYGADPRAPKVSPQPQFLPNPQNIAGMDSGTRNNPSDWRGGIEGYNDQLMVRDRHVYWDIGRQMTGVDGFGPAGLPGTYNNPRDVPPTPELRAVNRSVNPQIGSSNTGNQDDLSRQFTRNPQGMYVGEQGSGWSPVYGGVPGLFQPYGTRGGVPFPIESPVGEGEPGDGPRLVWAGPPHGLHSPTYPDGAQTLARYQVNPQMRPVRLDRPSNSPQAGQSYSQTVLAQGAAQAERAAQARSGAPGLGQGYSTGRGWSGVAK